MSAEAVYATPGYGFLCLPRDITQRLAEAHYHFDESNAVLHFRIIIIRARIFSLWSSPRSVPRRRWGWEKTKVWRFFKKHADAFPLYKLPGSFGCLIFNTAYPAGQSFALPSPDHIVRIIEKIRIYGNNAHFATLNDHQRLCKMVAWYSRRIMPEESEGVAVSAESECRVASPDHNNTRAYFSLCGHCRNSYKDCRGNCTPTANAVKPTTRAAPQTGPPANTGGIEYGTFDGIPLW